MKEKKRNQEWFERKVAELGNAMRELPDERQLELFADLEGGRTFGPATKSDHVKAAIHAYSPERRDK